jgi:predicted NUDIX family NTP pyrophosphohydrolase
MSIHSAGILCYRYQEQVLQVLLVHPGGPFWSKRDAGAWSIPKGLIEDNEQPLAAALREFREETGITASGEFLELGQLKQPSKKIVHAWALQMDLDPNRIKSNTFTLEWPRGSGNLQEYPEVDKGDWFTLDEARVKILKGQQAFLDRLQSSLGGRTSC